MLIAMALGAGIHGGRRMNPNEYEMPFLQSHQLVKVLSYSFTKLNNQQHGAEEKKIPILPESDVTTIKPSLLAR